MKIALCSNIKEFQKNRCLDKSFCQRYPGASWMPYFAQLAKKKRIDVVSGDIALLNCTKGKWNFKDILVIQELNAQDGKKLISKGAYPFILTCFESPLVAYRFYDQLNSIAPQFKNRLLFSGSFKEFNIMSGNNFQLNFPNFYKKNINKIKKWNTRAFMVSVVSNKYYRMQFNLSQLKKPKTFARFIREQVYLRKSKTLGSSIKEELHTKRLEAIEYFGNSDRISLFGPGWKDLSQLPPIWRKRLKTFILKSNPGTCIDKIKTMSNYKFAICFENVSYPGYVTEKIIDCFVAGVIPIYLGAPDIVKFIPDDSFIDMRSFDTWSDLDKYLNKITEEKAIKMISKGRDFLNSEDGKLYSHEGFAENIIKLLPKGEYIK